MHMRPEEPALWYLVQQLQRTGLGSLFERSSSRPLAFMLLLANPIRQEEAKEVLVRILTEQGVEVRVISGDNPTVPCHRGGKRGGNRRRRTIRGLRPRFIRMRRCGQQS